LHNLHASKGEEPSNPETYLMETRFIEICGKVIVFLKENPSKNNLDLDGLLNERVINIDEYVFIKMNNIKYNPPSSAGPYDNYLSIFDKENENGTSSHILYDLVDIKDPGITKTGDISSLNRFLSEWYAFPSNIKSMYFSKNEDLTYFSICFFNNEYWDKQHLILIGFPETKIDKISRFKELMHVNNIEYNEYIAQSSMNLTALLPSDLTVIKSLCIEILDKIFFVSPDDVIQYTPDGFRFNKVKKLDGR
jgi:hypothetical protein